MCCGSQVSSRLPLHANSWLIVCFISDKLQLLTAIMCSLLVVICVALLCVIPRAMVRKRRESHKQRGTCKCHEHRIKDHKLEKHNQHQCHHHHIYRHHYAEEIKKDLEGKQENTLNPNKDRRNVYRCKCNYQGESPPSSKREECCDGKSISYMPISQCSLLSSSSLSSTWHIMSSFHVRLSY